MVRVTRVILAVCLLVFAGAADAPPLAGNWQIIIVEKDSTAPLWLLKLEQKDDKWSGSISSAEGVIQAKPTEPGGRQRRAELQSRHGQRQVRL